MANAGTSLEVQKYVVDPVVTMFEIDASSIGGDIYKVTPSINEDSTQVVWRDATDFWQPYPIEVSGYDEDGQGVQPRPKMMIATNKIIASAIFNLGDLIGIPVVRYRVFEKFMFGQSDFNPNEIIDTQRFYIQRKTLQNREVIEFELGTSLAKENIILPRITVTRELFAGVQRVTL